MRKLKLAMAGAVAGLESEDGADILAYGGPTFPSSLVAEGVVDEFHLFINPAFGVIRPAIGLGGIDISISRSA